MTIPAEPQFYAQLRGTIARHGPKIAVFEVRVGVREDGSAGTVVHTVTEISSRTPDDIMSEVKEAVDSDSAHWPGLVRYQVAAVDQDNNIVGGRIIVERRGRGKPVDVDSGDGEEASPRGHVSQMMRQNAEMFRLTLQNNQIMLDLMARSLIETNGRNAQLTERHLSVLSLGEDILDRKAERDLRITREKKSDELKEKAFSVVAKFLPVLAGKVLRGTSLEPEVKQLAQNSQLSVLVDGFKKDPARFAKILDVLKAEEKIALFSQDIGPIVEAMMNEPERFAPLADLLSMDEKIALAQLAEMHEEEKKRAASKTPEPEKAKGPEIVVTEVTSIDEARKKRQQDGGAA